MKPVASLVVAGAAGLILFKVLGLFVLPMFALALAVFFAILKVAIVVGLIWLAIRLFSRPQGRTAES